MHSVVVLAVSAALVAPALVATAGTTPPPGPVEYTGAMGDQVPDARYPMSLAAGQGVRITAEAVSGDLDPVISIEDALGETVAINDDRASGDLNSELGYVSPASTAYTLVVSNVSPTSGEYRVAVSPVDPTEIATLGRESLSGPALAYDTSNFSVHYTTVGEDA